MDFDELLSGADDRRESVALGRTKRAPPQTTRASRDSARMSNNFANSLANELMLENQNAFIDI